MPEDYLSDAVNRQVWDQDYQQRHGQATALHQELAAPVEYERPGNIRFTITTREGQFRWEQGTARDVVETCGPDAVRMMIAQAFCNPHLMPHPQTALPSAPNAAELGHPALPAAVNPGLAFPVYPEPIPPLGVYPDYEYSGDPPQAQRFGRIRLAWQINGKHIANFAFGAVWIAAIMVTLNNPAVRDPLSQNAFLKVALQASDVVNLVRHYSNWQASTPQKKVAK